MDIRLANEIIACLPRGRTMFHYYKHRYAVALFAQQARRVESFAQIRSTPFRRLLDNPTIKAAMAAGDTPQRAALAAQNLNAQNNIPFLLTLDVWSEGSQVSRPGSSLVLQLNFTRGHTDMFARLVKPQHATCFRSSYHPVMQPGKREFFRETLAWARIDLDFALGEALIEEIQTDWLRHAKRLREWAVRSQKNKKPLPAWLRVDGTLPDIVRYADEVLRPYREVWEEAMLFSAIDFIYRELGIAHIYYHTFETGRCIKRIGHNAPPRSIYTDLPLKFCFTSTANPPWFLLRGRQFRRRLRQMRNPSWYQLRL